MPWRNPNRGRRGQWQQDRWRPIACGTGAHGQLDSPTGTCLATQPATSLTGRLGQHRQTRTLSCAPCGTQAPVRAGELLALAEEPTRVAHSQTDPHKQGSVASGLEGYIRTMLHCTVSRFVLSQHRDL